MMISAEAMLAYEGFCGKRPDPLIAGLKIMIIIAKVML
jgi:hypothetical protein